MMRPERDRHEQEGELGNLEITAAAWALRRHRGLTDDEAREFRRWLELDRRHAGVFAEMEETSNLLDQLREPSSVFVRPPPRPGKVRMLDLVALAAAALAGILLVHWHLASAGSGALQSLTTGAGELRRLELSDGSAVQLNSQSAIEIDYTASARRVRLARGEAFFTVVKNPSRPFFVESGAISVRAVGTAFNVRYRSHLVEVLVTEGKVRIDDRTGKSVLPPAALWVAPARADSMPGPAANSSEGFLVAGEQADIPVLAGPAQPTPIATVTTVEAPEMEAMLGWREHVLEFSSTPLSEVVAEFNRYNRHKLVIADATLAKQRFGGAFAPHDYEALVEALEQSFGVMAEQQGDETILRRNR